MAKCFQVKVWFKRRADTWSDAKATVTLNINISTSSTGTAAAHTQAVRDQLASGADIFMCVQPGFATLESQLVDFAGRISLHGATANDAVFLRNLPGVVGVAPSSSHYTTELLKSYKSHKITKVICKLYRPRRVCVLLQLCAHSLVTLLQHGRVTVQRFQFKMMRPSKNPA